LRKKVGVIGASGYAGFTLLEILSRHPKVELVVRNSRQWGGKKISEGAPIELVGNGVISTATFTNYSIDEINEMHLDLVFLAQREDFGKEVVAKLNSKTIDLSRDFRFVDPWVYGLPEIFGARIKDAWLVANPGCYATASILSVFPLVKNGLVDYVLFDCKSGYSGAGRTLSYLNNPKNYENNIIAYKIAFHQHRSEIEKCLGLFASPKVRVSFTPHVIPVFRGIMVTSHILLRKKIDVSDVKCIYKKFSKNLPFVRIFEERLPDLHDVVNTNYCCIGGFEIDDNNQLVLIATIDNLIKGASGEAIQNMNLMFGFDETEGLL